MCEHKWEYVEYRDNQYRFIELYWCPECGALKRTENFQGGGNKEEIKLPKLFMEEFYFVSAKDDLVKAMEHKIFYTIEDAEKYVEETKKQLPGIGINIYRRAAIK